jgi:hypothetical protein
MALQYVMLLFGDGGLKSKRWNSTSNTTSSIPICPQAGMPRRLDIIAKPWFPRQDNALGGKMHVLLLENLGEITKR